MHKWQNCIMNKNINKRVAELRLHLEENGLAAYIFPSTDPHHSESPPSTGRHGNGFPASTVLPGRLSSHRTMPHCGPTPATLSQRKNN